MPIAKTQILAIRNDTNPEIEMILNIARGTTDPEYWVISTAWNNLAPDMEQAKNPECQAGRVDIAVDQWGSFSLMIQFLMRRRWIVRGGRGLNSNHRKSRAVPKSSSVTLISMQPIHLPNLIADYINRCYKWSNIVMDWHNQRPVQWIWPKGQKWTNKSWSINNLGWCVLLIFALNLEHFLRGNKERVLETFPVIYNVGNGKKSCGHERNWMWNHE